MCERTKTKLILKAVSHSIQFFTHHRDQQLNVFVELETKNVQMLMFKQSLKSQ